MYRTWVFFSAYDTLCNLLQASMLIEKIAHIFTTCQKTTSHMCQIKTPLLDMDRRYLRCTLSSMLVQYCPFKHDIFHFVQLTILLFCQVYWGVTLTSGSKMTVVVRSIHEYREYWMIYKESQSFSRSCDLAPNSSPPPPSVNKLDRRHTGRLWKRNILLTEEGGKGVGKEPNHTTPRKPGPISFNNLCMNSFLTPTYIL